MGFDVSVRIGGQAGQGLQSTSSIMGKIFTRHGYYAYIHQDVESRIRGGTITPRSGSVTILYNPSNIRWIFSSPLKRWPSMWICLTWPQEGC
jgi:hypothetical protein